MATHIGRQVGHRIRQLRIARGLTQAQLADLVGKSVETISNFERGKTVTSLLTLAELGRHLNVPMREFFDEGMGEIAEACSSSKRATSVTNVLRLLPDSDVKIVATVAKLLSSRTTKRTGKPVAKAKTSRRRQ